MQNCRNDSRSFGTGVCIKGKPIKFYALVQKNAKPYELERIKSRVNQFLFQVVDLRTGDNMKPEYLAMNPMHNIPTVKVQYLS